MDAARRHGAPGTGRLTAHLLLAALAAATVLMSACGDDSDSSGSSGSSATTTPDAGLSVEVTPTSAAPGGTVKARVVNGTDEQFTYGLAYELERQSGNTFEPVKLPPRPVPEIGLVANPGETGPPVAVKIPADALPGQYRVVIQRDVPDVGDLSGEFRVTGEY